MLGLKSTIEVHIFTDMKTTFKMALPPIFLILSNELLLISQKVLPLQTQSAGNYTILGVAIFTVLILKKKFFLSQALAVYFVASGLDHFPSNFQSDMFNVQESTDDPVKNFFAHFAIVWAVLCYGLSYVVLEKILKSSEVSLWIRGIQLNLFIVPFSLLMSFTNDWLNEDSRGFFENFNIVAWFFIIFKIAQQMMELFVIKIADSIYRFLALATSIVIIGILKNPFSLEDSYEQVPVKLGAGLVLAGICIYTIMDHYFLKWDRWDSELNDDEREPEYRDLPLDYNETLSKGYETVLTTVSSTVSHADASNKLVDDSLN